MSLTLLGIGTALPDHAIAQRDAATLAATCANASPGRERALEALDRKSGIRTRGSVLLAEPGERPFSQEFFPPAETSAGGGPSTGERLARYALEADMGMLRSAEGARLGEELTSTSPPPEWVPFLPKVGSPRELHDLAAQRVARLDAALRRFDRWEGRYGFGWGSCSLHASWDQQRAYAI